MRIFITFAPEKRNLYRDVQPGILRKMLTFKYLSKWI